MPNTTYTIIDGIAVPLIRGGSDEGDLGGGEEPGSFSDALDAVGGAPDLGGDPADGGDGLPPAAQGDGTQRESVPWDEYVGLRRENASYRQRFQPFEQTFGALPEETATAFLELAKLYAEDPDRAAIELARSFGIDVDGGGDTGFEGEPQGMTPEQVREAMREEMASFFQQQRSDAQREQELAGHREQIRDTAKGLGYEPDSAAYKRLLTVARDEFSTNEFGDPVPAAKAVELAAQHIARELETFEREAIKKYLAGKDGAGGVSVTTTGDAPSGERPISDLDDSRRALAEFLGAG